MHERKRGLKNKLTKNIFRSTLYDFRADLFLICRARSRVRRKNHLAPFSFWRRSCQNCIINGHWSYKNPWISSRAKRPAHFKAHWPTRTWMNECRMGKYNFNGAAHRITCCTAIRHTADFNFSATRSDSYALFYHNLLSAVSQKAAKSAYTQTRSGSDDYSPCYRMSNGGSQRDRTCSAKNSLTRSLITLRSITFIHTILIDYNCAAKVLFVVAWLPILPLSHGITRYIFLRVYFRSRAARFVRVSKYKIISSLILICEISCISTRWKRQLRW